MCKLHGSQWVYVNVCMCVLSLDTVTGTAHKIHKKIACLRVCVSVCVYVFVFNVTFSHFNSSQFFHLLYTMLYYFVRQRSTHFPLYMCVYVIFTWHSLFYLMWVSARSHQLVFEIAWLRMWAGTLVWDT